MTKGFFVLLIGIFLVLVPFARLSEIWLKIILVFLGVSLIGIGYAVTSDFFKLEEKLEEKKDK